MQIANSGGGHLLNNAFTLIELLAVIIILAIVALIATPIILNVISDARISAGRSEARMIYSGINNYCATSKMEQELNGTPDICADGVTKEEVNDMVNLGNAIVNKVTYEDDKLTELEVESNGHIFKLCADGSFVMDDEVCEASDDEVAIIHTGPIEDVVLSNFPFLETDNNGCVNPGSNNYSYMGGCYLKGGIDPKENFYSLMLSMGFTSKEEIDARFFETNGEFKAEEFENWYIQFMIDSNQAENEEAAQEMINQGLQETGANTIFEAMFGANPEEYFQGKAYNNYLWYSGFLWRIMGINADGSVRLITEENVTTIPWGAENTALNYDGSHAKDWLNNYFYPRLKGNDIIVEQTWCSETATSISSARTNCSNNLSTGKAKVGLISLDENNLAGADSSYLVNQQVFWTLTPYDGSYAWYVSRGSGINDGVISALGLRAVINVNSNVTITGGNGTLGTTWSSNAGPYILNEDKSIEVTGKLNEKATSGEYVLYAGKKYRVVDKDNNGNTKLILDGYYEENGSVYEMKYGSNNTFSTTTGIGQKLNNDVLEWLVASSDTENRDKLVTNYTWYQNELDYGDNYTISLEETNPTRSINATVGLIRVGEMLSSQSSSILTKGYTTSSSFGNATDYWTMTPGTSSSYAWLVHNHGDGNYNGVSYAGGLRAVIVVNSNVTITSGNGTWSSPYEI